MIDRRINLLRVFLRFAEAVWYYVRTVTRRVIEHDILFLASGLAFNGVLTLIPLMLLLASALGMFLNSSALGVQKLNDILNTIFPPQPFAQQIRSSIHNVVSGIVMYRTSLGVFGFVVLVWTITSLFDAIRSVLHRVYYLHRTKGLLVSLLHDIGFISLVFVLFVAANLTIWVSTLAERVAREVPVLQNSSLVQIQHYVPTVIVVGVTTLMFYILYRYMTDEKPPNVVAVISTVTATVLWLAAGKIFSLYLTDVSAIGTIYGPYAFLLVLLFWIYYSSITFVFGAIVGQVHWERIRYLRKNSGR
jgi:membrane protein